MAIFDGLKALGNRVMNAIAAAVGSYRREYLSVDVLDPEVFSDYDARAFRYAFFWAFYENTVYQELVHTWAKTFKTREGLYKYIRGIYNPAARICNFSRDHIWAGQLAVIDRQAMPEGALPIVTNNPALRGAIGALWQASNWQSQKDLTTLWGSIYGDVCLMVVDDPARRKVSLRIVNPGNLIEVERDFSGNVKAYTFEEIRLSGDEDDPLEAVTYRETAERDGVNVVYRTYREGKPFDWGNGAAEWSVPYGFIPIVVIPHIDVGLNWGFSELHTGRVKFAEVDDIASKLNDQIRKIVDSKWLASGVDDPSRKQKTLQMSTGTPTTNKPQPGREEEQILYAPQGAAMQPLVAPLPIAETGAEIERILARLGDDYPELELIKMSIRGQLSGVALRTAREPVADKIIERRGRYDDYLVRIQRMAVAIGGWRGYAGYDGFDLGSYERGDLEHKIGDRPVFKSSFVDDIEQATALWGAAEIAGKAGVGLEAFLREIGWDDERIARVIDSEEFRSRQAAMRAGMMMESEEG